jgi:hypothetical protein
MHYPQIKQPNPEDLAREREIYEDKKKLADAELRKIIADLGLTEAELQVFRPYIDDYWRGRMGSEQLRNSLRHASLEHRQHILIQSRSPQIERCQKCKHLHSPNDACPKKIEWPKPRGMTRAQAFAELHLAENAPAEVIRSAYLRLARIHHPDNGGDANRMKAINAAYAALTKGK